MPEERLVGKGDFGEYACLVDGAKSYRGVNRRIIGKRVTIMTEQNILKKAVGVIMLMSVALIAMAESSPKPPESLCGFIFGSADEGKLEVEKVKLEKPFRFCTEATIWRTKNDRKIYQIQINGQVDVMRVGDVKAEVERMSKVVEQHFGVSMERYLEDTIGGFFFCEYSDATSEIHIAGCWHENVPASFSVDVKRKDIVDSKFVEPLPPGYGADVL